MVQDPASTSDFEGSKIKDWESALDAAREAKNEVHCLTTASSELGGDLQKTRQSVVHRTGSLSVGSLGSANLTPDRKRLIQSSGRLASAAQLERKVDLAIETSSQNVASEREARTREVVDVCSAVKSMQDWETDVESTVTQRFEVRACEMEAVTVRT